MSAHPKSSTFVQIAAVVGGTGGLMPLAAILGSRFGLIDADFARGVMVQQWAAPLAAVGVVLGLIALIVSLRDRRRLLALGAFALIAPAIALGLVMQFKAAADKAPPIHDVATNWDQTLGFSRKITDARAGSPNAVQDDPIVPAEAGAPWAGRRVAEVNAESCPGAKPILKTVTEDQVAAAFEAAGVEVQGRAPWRVEGTYTSFWWGSEDDIVARIDPERTDIRSISRTGLSDSGANCARVTKIVKALGG